MRPSEGRRKDPIRVPIRTGEIRLDQFLKWAGVAPTGGQAKALVQEGQVTVNDRPELRRSRTLRPGDVISVGGREGETYEVAGGAGDGS